MREIIFKAKTCNGEWVEGLLTVMWGQYHIINPNDENTAYPIDEKTICQYTGLTDKNRRKIFENDIVAYWDTYSTENGYAEADCIGEVYWDDETLSFQVTERLSAESYEVLDECSVVGNVFDNPEMLEKGR